MIKKIFSNPVKKGKAAGRLEELQKHLGLKFKKPDLLDLAFTHRSYTNEHGDHIGDNERLEFLGDSVLALIVNEYLYTIFPDQPEGVLASIKSRVVSGTALARIAEEMSLTRYLLLGKGERDTGGTGRLSTKENLLEALLGAVYLDKGLDEARKFILPHVKNLVSNVNKIDEIRDYKTILQEHCQKMHLKLPSYKLLSETGPDHDKVFTVKVTVVKVGEASAKGKSKRKAEQNAAKKILQKI